MKELLKRLAVSVLMVTACIISANAESLESQLQGFFSYNNNQAYKVLSKFAHPTNKFQNGYCEVIGDNVYITIVSSGYTARYLLRKNGSSFNNLEVLDDNDWYPAFKATNDWKDFAVSFWRDFSAKTFEKIEKIFGNLDYVSSERMCLAALTGLLWKYPNSTSSYTSDYSDDYDDESDDDSDYLFLTSTKGNIDNKHYITMRICVERNEVYGFYYYNKYGPEYPLSLSGYINGDTGEMYLIETDKKNGKETGSFDGYISEGGWYKGTFYKPSGEKMPFRINFEIDW